MNPFRHLLLAAGGHAPVGTWVVSCSPLVAEAIGHAGFDWAVLDMAHSPLDAGGVLQMLQALAATRLVPLVRLPDAAPATVERVLDAGAATVMVSRIATADDARAAVAATRYPPAGGRGVGAMSRASRYGTLSPQPGHTVGVIAMIESEAALQAIDAIAAVDGIDALFVAPSDLAASMGLLGEPGHRRVAEAMAQAVRQAHAAGKPIGSVGATPELAAQQRAAGFDFVAVASDLGLLMRGAHEVVAALRTRQNSHMVHSLSGGTLTPESAP